MQIDAVFLVPHKRVVTRPFVTRCHEQNHQIEVGNNECIESEMLLSISECLPTNVQLRVLAGSYTAIRRNWIKRSIRSDPPREICKDIPDGQMGAVYRPQPCPKLFVPFSIKFRRAR